jgi:hypothetical protein
MIVLVDYNLNRQALLLAGRLTAHIPQVRSPDRVFLKDEQY